MVPSPRIRSDGWCPLCGSGALCPALRPTGSTRQPRLRAAAQAIFDREQALRRNSTYPKHRSEALTANSSCVNCSHRQDVRRSGTRTVSDPATPCTILLRRTAACRPIGGSYSTVRAHRAPIQPRTPSALSRHTFTVNTQQLHEPTRRSQAKLPRTMKSTYPAFRSSSPRPAN